MASSYQTGLKRDTSTRALALSMPAGTIAEFPIPGSPTVSNICLGPDGNLWFTTEAGSPYLGKITHEGIASLYTLPLSGNHGGICVGPDGWLWFTDFTNNSVIKLDPASPNPASPVLTTYACVAGAGPGGIASDGTNLWFIESTSTKLTRITTAGVQTQFTPGRLEHGPGMGVGAFSGILYTCAQNTARIDQTAVATGVTTLLGNVPAGAGSTPYTIVEGPDGNLWYTEFGNLAGVGRVAKITHAGVSTEYAIPTANPTMGGICAGPDGNLWATEKNGNKIARITTAGVITEYACPTAGANPDKICATADGRLAFTEHDIGKIGFITT